MFILLNSFCLYSPTDKEHDEIGYNFLLVFTPKLAMKFNSVEDANEFYNRYGVKKGFSIRCDNIRTVQDDVMKFHSFCC
jgi:hypothetical protein